MATPERGGTDSDSQQKFETTFAHLISELASKAPESDLKAAYDHFHKVLLANVPHGKKNRGLSVVTSYKLLIKHYPHIPEEDDMQAIILGWCVEMLQAFFLVADDIMDQSHTRRGQPCWFRNVPAGKFLFGCRSVLRDTTAEGSTVLIERIEFLTVMVEIGITEATIPNIMRQMMIRVSQEISVKGGGMGVGLSSEKFGSRNVSPCPSHQQRAPTSLVKKLPKKEVLRRYCGLEKRGLSRDFERASAVLDKGVGLMAINDAFYLENAVYMIIKAHFDGLPCYVKILELFHEVTMQTITGQCLDMVSSQADAPVDFSAFTNERYSAIVKYKTAFYSFYLPVALAMYLAGIYDSDPHQRAKEILLEMGHFFQVQDDYLDCFGDPEVLGKIGTDIQDKKCSWLVVKALEICTPQQRAVLENYGIDKPECIERVKRLYSDLNLPAVYAAYEEDSAKRITELIRNLSGDLPDSIFLSFFHKIFKRQK